MVCGRPDRYATPWNFRRRSVAIHRYYKEKNWGSRVQFELYRLFLPSFVERFRDPGENLRRTRNPFESHVIIGRYSKFPPRCVEYWNIGKATRNPLRPPDSDMETAGSFFCLPSCLDYA